MGYTPEATSRAVLGSVAFTLLVYTAAAVVATFSRRDWAWRRFTPLLFSGFVLIPVATIWLKMSDSLRELAYACYLPAFVLLVFTCFLSWRHRGAVARTLAITSTLLLIYAVRGVILAL